MVKKNTRAKIFVVICLIIVTITVIAFSACNSDVGEENISYDVKNFVVDSSIILKERDFVKKIDSFKQLSTFVNDVGIQCYNKDSYIYNTDLGRTFRSYDKKYFRKNSLIVTYVVKGFPQPLELKNLEVNGNSMTISILNELTTEDLEGNWFPDEIVTYVWFIEVNKKLVKKINEFIINEITHIGE